MENEDVVDISQDVGVVSIVVNVNFGIDTYDQVGWACAVTHMSHTFIQVLVESRYSNLQTIEGTNDDLFITSIRNPFISKDGQ